MILKPGFYMVHNNRTSWSAWEGGPVIWSNLGAVISKSYSISGHINFTPVFYEKAAIISFKAHNAAYFPAFCPALRQVKIDNFVLFAFFDEQLRVGYGTPIQRIGPYSSKKQKGYSDNGHYKPRVLTEERHKFRHD